MTYAPNELAGIDEAHRRSILTSLWVVALEEHQPGQPSAYALMKPLFDRAVWAVEEEVLHKDMTEAHVRAMKRGQGAAPLGRDCAAALPAAAAREKLARLLLAIAWVDGLHRPGKHRVVAAILQDLGIPPRRVRELEEEAWVDPDILSAAARGRLETVRKKLDAGEPVMARDRERCTPLHLAASRGHLEVVDLLLERGADVHARTAKGLPPLCLASMGHPAVVARLLAAGARPDEVSPSNFSPLIIASRAGHLGVARVLRKGGAALETTDENGRTPLHWAALLGHSAMVAFLVTEGAAIDARAPTAHTALMFAAEKGDLASVTALLAARADVHAVDVEGKTALHLAATHDAADIIATLAGLGASLEARTKEGLTPLHIAAMMGWTSSVKALLDAGASLDATNPQGGTAIVAATVFDRRETMDLLVSRGARIDESQRGVGLSVKSFETIPLTTSMARPGMRPCDEALAAWRYLVPFWTNVEASGDARTSYVVVTEEGGTRWLPLFTSEASAQAFRDANPGAPLGIRAAEPNVFAIGTLPIEGVLLDPYDPRGAVAVRAEDCERIARGRIRS